MVVCILVSNSLKKDPRVIKQIKCAINEGHNVYFIGVWDRFYDEQFLNSVGCNYNIIDMGDEYKGKLKSPFKKIWRRFKYTFGPISIIKRIRPDIIHANDFDTLPAAYIAARICGCKVIYDSHEIFAENIDISNHKILKRIIIALEGYLIKRVDSVISVSNSSADYLKNKYKINRPIVITNCPYKYNGPYQEKPKDVFEVVHHGIFSKGRGYEQYISASKYTNENVRLVVRGYGSIENELRNIAQNEDPDNRVEFAPPVEIANIVTAASHSHIAASLTCPININFKYSVSNKLFEYVHAGLPVILSDIPEHRYLNDKYKFGIIIDQVTPEKIAEAIDSIASNETLYQKLRINAIKMSEEMCWENESKKLLELYEKGV